MKILVVGNGAREHAICIALKKSKKNPEIVNFANATNPGIALLAKKIELGNLLDFEHLIRFAQAEKPDFAILGPDDPIGAGAADELLKIGIASVGPTKSLARLESSKSFTRELLRKYEIDGNPRFRTFFADEEMESFAKECGEIVVKFDGLAGGKGVRVQGDHFATTKEGLEYANDCLQKTGKVVIEEKITGQEFSLMFFVDGETITPMPVVQDNKRAFVGDQGPNTGGMGSISDNNHSLPFLSETDIEEAKEITMKTIGALQAECEDLFKGIVFGGFMATGDGVRLIEYNVRFGDPEALNILPLLVTDFVSVCEAIISGDLARTDIEFLEQATVCKYIVPEGYPSNPTKNVPVQFDKTRIPDGVQYFFASIDQSDGNLILKGSRAIAVVGMADSIAEAQYLAEDATKAIIGPVYHREDIGTVKLIKQKTEMMQKLRG